MKYLKRYSRSITILLAVFLVMNVIPVLFGAALNDDSGQVQVPLVVDVSYAVAGVEFAFEYSSGLEFVSYEKSPVVSSAINTPVAVRDGRTYLGFYNVDNRYVPENGKLDCGHLIFNRSSNGSQSVKLIEIKLVQIIDKDTTRSTLLAPVEIKISPESNTENSTTNTNNNNSSNNGGDDAVLSSGTKSSSIVDGDSVSSSDAKNSPVNDDDDKGILSPDSKGSSVDDSKDGGLSVNFWVVVFVVLVVVICGVGVFVFSKKTC
ncbi:MAG: hypothetical protein LBH62_06195 [Nitrososphaerota archaeon]|jgi:hypothetical protein|nr:hypothetical protein [Nitrososphaerota archaeon]